MGWRANTVLLDPSGEHAWLAGVHHKRRYRPEAQAACTEFDHHAPASGCHCGLHAWPTKKQACDYRDQWHQQALCRVELHGEIIFHGDLESGEIEGFRASQMTTLGVEFSPECVRCRCETRSFGTIERALPNEWLSVHPVCERCTAHNRMSGPDLAARLGTEVSFSPAVPRTFFQRSLGDPSRSTLAPFASVAAVFSAMSAYGLVRSLAGHQWPIALLWAVLTIACLVGLSVMLSGGFFFGMSNIGKRTVERLGVWSFIGVALFFLPVFPALMMLGANIKPVANSPTVEQTVGAQLPGDIKELRLALENAGAKQVSIGDVDSDRRAVSYTEKGLYAGNENDECKRLGLLRQPDGTYTVATRSSHPVTYLYNCDLAYPVDAAATGGSEPTP